MPPRGDGLPDALTRRVQRLPSQVHGSNGSGVCELSPTISTCPESESNTIAGPSRLPGESELHRRVQPAAVSSQVSLKYALEGLCGRLVPNSSKVPRRLS